VTQLSRRETEARADAVQNAVAITRMEGGEPSAFCQSQLDRFVAGEISATEMRDRVLRHHQGE
jgi:hypothetical protein